MKFVNSALFRKLLGKNETRRQKDIFTRLFLVVMSRPISPARDSVYFWDTLYKRNINRTQKVPH